MMARENVLEHPDIVENSLNQADFQTSRSSFYPQSTSLPSTFPPSQYFSSTPVSPVNVFSDSFLFDGSPSILSENMECSGLNFSGYQFPATPDNYFNYAPTSDMIGQEALFSRVRDDISCPRTWQTSYDSSISQSLQAETVTPSYLAKGDILDAIAGERQSTCTQHNLGDFSRLSIGRHLNLENATPSLADMPSCRASDDGEDDIGEGVQSNSEDHMAEEPYAKLIFRALMAAPNHSMVLQEIYQWFLDNTDKGSSTSSGWRNSIRHNLSMNAAFRKTERPATSEESKKTSEWVLEPFAIRNGVTPTTRYRKKGKSSAKSENPAHPRVAAGRKGGMRTSTIKAQKMRAGLDYQDPMRSAPGRNRRKRHQIAHNMTPQLDYRQISPSTPNSTVHTPNPYYSYKRSPYDEILDGSDYSLANVHGIFPEESPLFCDGLQQLSEHSNFGWTGF